MSNRTVIIGGGAIGRAIAHFLMLNVTAGKHPLPNIPILVDKSGIYLRPEQNHFLCLVSPKPEDDGDDLILESNFAEFEEVMWPTLAERIPAFEALRVERAWAGYSEYNTIDQNGIVGRIGLENSFIAAGFSGHGLMHSPGIGRGMAELSPRGAYLSLDLSALSFSRFQPVNSWSNMLSFDGTPNLNDGAT